MTKIVLPNVRKFFIPSPDHTIFEVDLVGADAQVVAWEAEDEDLKAAFRAGLDVHDKNAVDMFGTSYTSLAGDKHHGPKSRKRRDTKQAVHLTNYGGTARTIGMVLGWTTHEADRFQRRWFEAHPGIRRNFQQKIEHAILTTRCVYNKFGFRRVYFDRPGDAYTEALAWVPQSTVALVTFKGAFALHRHFPQIRFLLQCHDSLVFEAPNWLVPELTDETLQHHLAYPIPYPDPLTIPWGIARSEKSWGEAA